jgi:hypothetical protein
VIGTPLQKQIDPVLETAVQGELSSEYFVLSEDQEQQSNRDTQQRK